jgi:hypothetical protein
MRIPIPIFVYAQWLIFIALAIVSVGTAMFFGWRGRGTLVFWRKVKVMSSLLGLIGLFFLLLNLESSARQSVDARNIQFLEFLDVKIRLTQKIGEWCKRGEQDEQGKLTCFDLHNMDNIINFVTVRDGTQLRAVQCSQLKHQLARALNPARAAAYLS